MRPALRAVNRVADSTGAICIEGGKIIAEFPHQRGDAIS